MQAATPGCTKEACAFRDQFGKFKDAGAEVFGVSTRAYKILRLRNYVCNCQVKMIAYTIFRGLVAYASVRYDDCLHNIQVMELRR